MCVEATPVCKIAWGGGFSSVHDNDDNGDDYSDDDDDGNKPLSLLRQVQLKGPFTRRISIGIVLPLHRPSILLPISSIDVA